MDPYAFILGGLNPFGVVLGMTSRIRAWFCNSYDRGCIYLYHDITWWSFWL